VIWAGISLAENGSSVIVPYKERSYFSDADSLWKNMSEARFHDYYCQTSKISFRPIKVHKAVKGGDIITWQDIEIKVLDTPGYTRGSVTYIMDIDENRFAFTGDLIYSDGKYLYLYSFRIL
jgi:glyoxylase-like metal-dependent hydrolase (beta-lactamase superfamily II)